MANFLQGNLHKSQRRSRPLLRRNVGVDLRARPFLFICDARGVRRGVVASRSSAAGQFHPPFSLFLGEEKEKTGRGRSKREKDAGETGGNLLNYAPVDWKCITDLTLPQIPLPLCGGRKGLFLRLVEIWLILPLLRKVHH